MEPTHRTGTPVLALNFRWSNLSSQIWESAGNCHNAGLSLDSQSVK